MSLLLTQADARHLPFADGSVQCCVTSPPYWGLRDYGVPGQLGLESSPDAYVAAMVAVFREVRRVLRDEATLWLNLGDSYCTRSVRRDDGMRTVVKAYSGDAELPTWSDYASRGRAKYSSHLRADGLKDKDLVGIPWRVAFALQAAGWYLRSDIVWAKPNPMPESVTDRPTKAHEYLFLLVKSERYFYDADAIREPFNYGDPRPMGNKNAAARRVTELTGNMAPDAKLSTLNPAGRNRRSVWTVTTQPYPQAHFATMPERLVEPCILAGSKAGDIVLDPFMGSGTVARVALRLGRRAVGCDLNPAYIDLQRERTRVTYGLPLDGDAA